MKIFVSSEQALLQRRHGRSVVLWRILIVLALSLPLGVLLPRSGGSGLAPTPAATAPSRLVLARLDHLPLAFEPNEGQAAAPVRYLAHGSGYTLLLDALQAVLALSRPSSQTTTRQAGGRTTSLVRLRLLGANPHAAMAGYSPQTERVNYLVGNDRSRWRTGIPTYGGLLVRGVYPGIDLRYHGGSGQLEYDYILQAGANPKAIRLQVDGAHLRLDGHGNLLLDSAGGTVVQAAPVAYQQRNGSRQAVTVRYALGSHGAVRLVLGAYDRHLPLVVDPTLSYSTYLGGNGADWGQAIALDPQGHAYVMGGINAGVSGFPVTSGAFQTAITGRSDVFVSKLTVDGSGLVYATYLGGSSVVFGYGIAVDGQGHAYIAGYTDSTGLPTSRTAFQNTFGGGRDAFVAKLTVDGSGLVYSTYLGGSGVDQAYGIAVDGLGSAYVTGSTGSKGDVPFPTTKDALQTTYGGGNSDAFVSKLNADGSALLYSTYLGGLRDDVAYGIAVDGRGQAYVAGLAGGAKFPITPGAFQTTYRFGGDPFVSKLTADGSGLVYSTYLGGGLKGSVASGIAVNSRGEAYVVGYTAVSGFPTTAGAFQTSYGGGEDTFVSKVTADGGGLAYSTFLGGTGDDIGTGIAIDGQGQASVIGSTSSSAAAPDGFPTTAGAFQTTYGGGGTDAFVSTLSADGSALRSSTYLGGTNYDEADGIAVDGAGNLFVTGDTQSENFPVSAGAIQTKLGSSGSDDAFVSRFAADTPTQTSAATATATSTSSSTPTSMPTSIPSSSPTSTPTGIPTVSAAAKPSITAVPTRPRPRATSTPVPHLAHSTTLACGGTALSKVALCALEGIWQVTVHHPHAVTIGTAFAVRTDRTGLYLVTSAHLLQGSAPKRILLTSPDGKQQLPALGVALAKGQPGSATDLAVLRIKSGSYAVLPWGTGTAVQVGRQVVSLRYGPGASTALTISQDAVTGVQRDVHDGRGKVWLTHGTVQSASLLDGPVVAANGTVIGVNVRAATATGTLAIPAKAAKPQTDQLISSLAAVKLSTSST